MNLLITAQELHKKIYSKDEIAVLDIREIGEFGESHLLMATSIPYSVLELRIGQMVPCSNAQIVLIASSDQLATNAARYLNHLGYKQVFILGGGVNAWRKAEFTLFSGVNVFSKVFGEWVEHRDKTPSVKPLQLKEWMNDGKPLVILDGRPFSEYQKMTIPSSICCPNGELLVRWRELVPNVETRVVINCAGRTRSIIGAQTLINLEIPNPVYALENGTQGWFLAGLALEHGSNRRYPDSISNENRVLNFADANKISAANKIKTINSKQLNDWLLDDQRTTYLFDVRTEEEYLSGSVAGSVHAPGGQLVQAADTYIAVHRARVVLFDNGDGRATIVANWLQNMRFEVYVLQSGTLDLQDYRFRPSVEVEEIAEFRPDERFEDKTLFIDIRESAQYIKSRINSSIWSSRSTIIDTIRKHLNSKINQIVLICNYKNKAYLVSKDIKSVLARHVAISFFDNEISDLVPFGFAIAKDGSPLSERDRIDFLFFTHDRHEGNHAAARQYLSWETNLLNQLDAVENDYLKL